MIQLMMRILASGRSKNNLLTVVMRRCVFGVMIVADTDGSSKSGTIKFDVLARTQ